MSGHKAIRIEIVNGYVKHVWAGDVDIADYVTHISAGFEPRPRTQQAQINILADVEYLTGGDDVTENRDSESRSDSAIGT